MLPLRRRLTAGLTLLVWPTMVLALPGCVMSWQHTSAMDTRQIIESRPERVLVRTETSTRGTQLHHPELSGDTITYFSEACGAEYGATQGIFLLDDIVDIQTRQASVWTLAFWGLAIPAVVIGIAIASADCVGFCGSLAVPSGAPR